MPDPLISVIVCTYNRAELLRGVLKSLAEQTMDCSRYEVLVIDNNSTDLTQQVAKEYAGLYNNFKVIREERQGKSYASNTGIAASKGKYIAFIDDDARATPDWLERILTAFKTVRPEPVAVGGEIHPWYEQAPPAWFADDFELRTWGDEKGFLQPPRARYGFSGSNMAFKRSILEAYTGFSTDYGPVGNEMKLGEETALFCRIYQEHPWFWYDPAIRVEHWVPTRNMTVRYHLRRAYMGGVSITSIHGEYSASAIVKTLLFIIFKSCIFPFRVKWWQKNWQRSFLKHAQPVAGSLGSLKALIFKHFR